MKVLIVANRLPATVKIDQDVITVIPSSGGLVSAMKGVKSIDAVWIGWPGCAIEPRHEQAIIEKCAEFNTVPVLLDKEAVELYYNGYCNSILWPVLHYVEDEQFSKDQHEMFRAYVDANTKFARCVLDNIKGLGPEELCIWVHDYHLMLVPQMLKLILPNYKIGFFLHTSFPNSLFWGRITHASILLQGLLHSDLIGVHIYTYKLNVLKSAQQLLGSQNELSIIPSTFLEKGGYNCNSIKISESQIDARGSNIGICQIISLPIGIDVDLFRKSSNHSSQKGSASLFSQRYSGRRIILGVDRLDYMKGIYQKLKGYERFLQKYPKLAKNTVLLQLAVPTRGEVKSYQFLSHQCHNLVAKINGKYQPINPGCTYEGTPAGAGAGAGQGGSHISGQAVFVEFWDASVKFPKLLNLYMASEICLITSVRDGMNLVAEEFIASCQEDRGVLCLSKFVGAERSLNYASVTFNPWNPDEIADALAEALNLNPEERRRRNQYGKSHVKEFSADTWATTFMTKLTDGTSPPLPEDNPLDKSLCGRSYYQGALKILKASLGGPGPSTPRPLYIFLDVAGWLREIQMIRSDGESVEYCDLRSDSIFPFSNLPLVIYLCDDDELLDDLMDCQILPKGSAMILTPTRFWKSQEWQGGDLPKIGGGLKDARNDGQGGAFDKSPFKTDLDAAPRAATGAAPRAAAGPLLDDPLCEKAVQKIEDYASKVHSRIRVARMENHAIIYYDDAESLLAVYDLIMMDSNLSYKELSGHSLCLHPTGVQPKLTIVDDIISDSQNQAILIGQDNLISQPSPENLITILSQEAIMYSQDSLNSERRIFMRSLLDGVACVKEALAY